MAVPPWLIKAAGAAAKNPEKAGKAVVKVVLGVTIAMCLLCAVLMELLSSFNGFVIDENFDVYSIPVYQEIQEAQDAYMDELIEEMDEIRGQIIEENTHTVDNEDGTTSEVCDVEVITQPKGINLAYALAYINYTESEIHRWQNANFNAEEIMDFYRSISEIRVSDRMEDVYYITNVILSSADVADMYFADNALHHQMYLASFDLYVSFLDSYGIVTDEEWVYEDGELQTEAITHDSGIEIPHYFQNDYPVTRYGTGTIASSGCAPTSLAMVISGLTGNTVTPKDVVAWTGNQYYVSGQGSAWSIFAACAKNWGLRCSNMGKTQKSVIEALEAGKPVIASMGPGKFTKGGHIIVIRGVTKDGNFLVNDPNKKNYKKYGTDEFKMSLVFEEAKNFWCFE